MNKEELKKLKKLKDRSDNPKLKKEISDKINAVKGNKPVLK